MPTFIPSEIPSHSPSAHPTKLPTSSPSSEPTVEPTSSPSYSPTSIPTRYPIRSIQIADAVRANSGGGSSLAAYPAAVVGYLITGAVAAVAIIAAFVVRHTMSAQDNAITDEQSHVVRPYHLEVDCSSLSDLSADTDFDFDAEKKSDVLSAAASSASNWQDQREIKDDDLVASFPNVHLGPFNDESDFDAHNVPTTDDEASRSNDREGGNNGNSNNLARGRIYSKV